MVKKIKVRPKPPSGDRVIGGHKPIWIRISENDKMNIFAMNHPDWRRYLADTLLRMSNGLLFLAGKVEEIEKKLENVKDEE